MRRVVAGALLSVLLAGCGQHAAMRPAISTRASAAPRPRSSLRAAEAACRAPHPVRAGATVRGPQLGAVDFLTDSTGIGMTDPQVSCYVVLPARMGVDTYEPRQTVRLSVSHDGGRTWTAHGAALPMTGTGLEQLAAISEDRMWAVSPAGQLFGTSDGGLRWKRELPDLRILSLAVSGGTAWAAVTACQPASGAASAVWVDVAEPPAWRWQPRQAVARQQLLPSVRLIPLSPQRAVLLVQGFERAGHLLSTSDGGLAWSTLSLPTAAASAPPTQTAFTASPGGAWYLLVSVGGTGMNRAENSVYSSTDDGRSWVLASADTSFWGPEPSGAPSSASANIIAAGSATRLWLANLEELQVSDDAGARWHDVPGVQLDGSGEFAQFDVVDPGHAWLLGWLTGLWRTTDGVHWRQI